MAIHALTIGINDYVGTQLDLAGCVNDAKDWAELLSPASKSVETLLDSRATREGILDATRQLLGKLQAGDWGVITYSGHGSWVVDKDGDEPDGRDEVIVPHDYKNVILDDEVFSILQSRRSGTKVVLISDSCHSGTLYRAIRNGLTPIKFRYFDASRLVTSKTEDREAEAISRRVRVGKVRVAPDVVHLAGCGDTQYCYDAEFEGKPNGAFTRVAIDCFRKLKVPTFQNWINLIRKKLPSYDYPQTPCLNAGTNEKQLLIPWTNHVDYKLGNS